MRIITLRALSDTSGGVFSAWQYFWLIRLVGRYKGSVLKETEIII